MGQFQSVSDSQITAQWEWKENTDPFSPMEKAKWRPYEPLQNFLVEKAHYNHQKEVDIGNYIVSIKDMLQRRKSAPSKQRPIRRNTVISQDEQENCRAERFFGAETPRTFTKVFGDLEAYLKFFENRGPGIQEFSRILSQIEVSQDTEKLNRMITPCLVSCIKNESKKVAKIKEKKALLKHTQYENRLLLLFQEPVMSTQQFYANVLKAYTMEGFLYKRLNLYLRNEDWVQLDCLLPYAYCLCRAFFRKELSPPLQGSPPLGGSQPREKMILYRGTHFDEAALALYDPNVTKNFSWNSMTSTSTNPVVAEKFMYRNIDLKKIPVMFEIEVPVDPHRAKNAIWIDMKPFTAIKNEDEIVLAPGSGFEILEISRKHNNQVVEIRLKLLTDVDRLMNQGQILHGTMQSKMVKENMMKISELEGRQLLETIFHLKGNQLLETIEFDQCHLNEKVAKNLLEILKTIPRLKKLVLTCLLASQESEHLLTIYQQLRKIKLSTLEISHRFPLADIEPLSKSIGSLTSLRSFSLTFSNDRGTDNRDFQILCSHGLKTLTSLACLNLKGLDCAGITDKELEIFSFYVLQNLNSLTSLSLSFFFCKGITDQGLSVLYNRGLKFTPLLTSLKLSFENSRITGENVETSSCFSNLKNLTSLNLSFRGCNEITGRGLNNLVSKGFECLPLLRDLDLDFRECSQIRNEIYEYLGNQGLKTLHSNIRIKFDGSQFIRVLNDADKIPSDFVQYDLNEDVEESPETPISLRFRRRIHRLKSTPEESIDPLEKLANFQSNLEMSSLEIRVTPRQPLKSLDVYFKTKMIHLTSLKSLRLNFSQNYEMTDEKLKPLEGLKHLVSLRDLSLDFTLCFSITDKGLNILSREVLKNLPLLESLTLDFSCCWKITNKGPNILCVEGIKHNVKLESLTMSFKSCIGITDEVLNVVYWDWIRHLTFLGCLDLYFWDCSGVKDEASLSFYKFLRSFGFQSLIGKESLFE